jgi:hypothetical protein
MRAVVLLVGALTPAASPTTLANWSPCGLGLSGEQGNPAPSTAHMNANMPLWIGITAVIAVAFGVAAWMFRATGFSSNLFALSVMIWATFVMLYSQRGLHPADEDDLDVSQTHLTQERSNV